MLNFRLIVQKSTVNTLGRKGKDGGKEFEKERWQRLTFRESNLSSLPSDPPSSVLRRASISSTSEECGDEATPGIECYARERATA